MSREYRCCRVVYIVVLLCSISLGLYADPYLSIIVNNTLSASYSYDELSAFSYDIPKMEGIQVLNDHGGPASGVMLDEIVPIMIEAWDLSLYDASEMIQHLSDDQLAEKLPSLAFALDDPNHRYRLSLTGERSSEEQMSIWLSWEGVDRLKEEIQRYAQMHGISITMLEVPKCAAKLSQTHSGGGEVPDAVMVQTDQIYELVVNEVLQPLDYMDLHLLDAKGLEAFSLFGRQWAVPFYFDTQVILANRDLLARAEVDPETIRTLSDIEDACMSLSSLGDEIIPITWNLYSAYWLLPFQLGFGKEGLIESDGNVIVDDEATYDAVTYLLGLKEQGLLAANERDAMFSKFVSGGIGMIVSSSYMIPELERLHFPFAVIPFPLCQQTGSAVSPLLDYKAFAIPKRSRNPILGRRLIQYMCGVGMQQRFPRDLHKLPALGAILDDEGHYAMLSSSYGRGYVIPPSIGYRIYKQIMWKMLRFMITGELSVEDGLAQAQKLISAQMAEYLPREQEYRQQLGTDMNSDTREQGVDNVQMEAECSHDDRTDRGFFSWLRKLWQ